MAMELTSSTQETPIQGSGAKGRAMVLEFNLALMVDVILGNSNAMSNMASVATISGKLSTLIKFSSFLFSYSVWLMVSGILVIGDFPLLSCS